MRENPVIKRVAVSVKQGDPTGCAYTTSREKLRVHSVKTKAPFHIAADGEILRKAAEYRSTLLELSLFNSL